jgi:hypothetical protein
MLRKNKNNLLLTSLAIPCVFLLFSCGKNSDLAKVREFSELSTRAKENLPKIADDVYRSCLRRSRYIAFLIDVKPSNSMEKKKLEELQKERERIDTSIDSLKSRLNTENPILLTNIDRAKTPFALRSGSERICHQQFRTLGNKVKRVNSIVVSYMETLGQVAAGDTVNLDTEFDRLRVPAKNLIANEIRDVLSLDASNSPPQKIIEEKVDAGISLINFLTEEILKARRRSLLKKIIPENNDSFQKIVDGIVQVVDRSYIGNFLILEEDALNSYYADYIGEILISKTATEGDSIPQITTTVLELEDRWNAEKDIIHQRRELAQSYVSSLNTISASHEALAKTYSMGLIPSRQEINAMLDRNNQALKQFVTQAKQIP